ncbi:MAG: tetratricopeptide repeat protein [Lentimicrobiaceae bacterium]|nr:tetratricopeptide repeat protein [Lentimicrobiaceae bacterium]
MIATKSIFRFSARVALLVVLFFAGQDCLFAQNDKEQLAYQYFRNQEFDKAADLFADLYKQKPNSHFYTYYLQCLLQTQNTKEAENLVRKQIKAFPNIPKYNVDLGYVFEMRGEVSKAKKQYEASIEAITTHSGLITELARSFQAYRLNEYAVKTYLHGRKLSGEPQTYSMEIAAIYEENSDYEKAFNEYVSALSQNEELLEMVNMRLNNWLLKDENNAKGEIIRLQTLKAINKYPDSKVFYSLMIWYSIQKKDFSGALRQAKALDKRYNEGGQRIFDLANIAQENKDYPSAIDGYNYILSLGENTLFLQRAKMMLLDVKLLQITTVFPVNEPSVQTVDTELFNYFQENRLSSVNFSLYQKWLRFKAVYLKDIETPKDMIETNLSSNTISPMEKAILKIDLGDILRLDDDIWEATLLYSQVEKEFPNDTIASLAKFKNAKLSFHIGEFEWAKSQLDVLRAATSKLIANDAMYLSLLIADNQDEEDSVNIPLRQFAYADFLMECNRMEEASILLDSIENNYEAVSLHDDVLYKKALIAVYFQKYKQADSLLAKLVEVYPNDLLADDALFERAKLQEFYLKDIAGAMESYKQLVTKYPDSIYVIDARTRFRELQDDMMINN